MNTDTAYTITKTYWGQKKSMGTKNAWWDGVSPDLLVNVYGKIHPGALKYYDEIGVKIPPEMR